MILQDIQIDLYKQLDKNVWLINRLTKSWTTQENLRRYIISRNPVTKIADRLIRDMKIQVQGKSRNQRFGIGK